jgi:predicted nucleic acid-binding protein
VDYLADTNVLLNALQQDRPLRKRSRDALKKLYRSGNRICVAPQNIVEFWRGCTRPANGGLGLSPEETAIHVARIEGLFVLLPDRQAIHSEWKRLVETYRVAGKEVHDARLVAFMVVNNIARILTFDAKGFSRYKFIRAVHPDDVLSRDDVA